MKNLNECIKEYNFYTEKLKMSNVYIWFNHSTNKFFVSVFYTRDYVDMLNINFELIK